MKKRLFSSALIAAKILLVFVSLPSCKQTAKQKDWSKYKFGVTLYGGKGMGSGYSQIYCDSFQMTDLLSADIWVDGKKMSVKAEDRLAVWSNIN
jgi:hypothetical protein